MRILVLLSNLGIGGTEMAAFRWAVGLKARGHGLRVLAFEDGPRRTAFGEAGIDARLVPAESGPVSRELRAFQPDLVHVHAPGFATKLNVLGDALGRARRPPVIQTNVFGRLDNPTEDRWTDFRLFVSWTSCVQAAWRSGRQLDQAFFRRASVAVYPVDPDDGPTQADVRAFRQAHGLRDEDVCFGRISRPDPIKWTDATLTSFSIAVRRNPRLKLLLREPPQGVARALAAASQREHFLVLPATADPRELRLTMASLDAVLHLSAIGESFGYGIAEPMNLGKPVITNCVPWLDQGQIELVRHGECGFLASTSNTIAGAILRLADNPEVRARMGQAAQQHIRSLANPRESLDVVEAAFLAAVEERDNERVQDDVDRARECARYLRAHQFGRDWRDRLALRARLGRRRLGDWYRRVILDRA